MATDILLTVEKPGLPPGSVLLEDMASLAQGLHDAFTRMVQFQLGYPARTKLCAEAKSLTAVVVVDILEGSGVIKCRPFPPEGHIGRPPVAVVVDQVINGLKTFTEHGRWPSILPAVVRNRIGAAVAPVLVNGTSVRLSLQENNKLDDCLIGPKLRAALQKPEEFPADEPVELVGKIYDINLDTMAFRVDTKPRRVTVSLTRDQVDQVDEFRWKRVFVSGLPLDRRCRKLAEMHEIRLASLDEEDGIKLPREQLRGENTNAFVATRERLAEISELKPLWDSYDAVAPIHNVVDFGLEFLRDACAVFLDRELDPPTPFAVPTTEGGLQYEWEAQGRELELEIPRPGIFRYLKVVEDQESEGYASRWHAIRLMQWVATGEQA